MVKLAMVNSRIKDFYDIYTLSVSYNFQSDSLKRQLNLLFKGEKLLSQITH